MKIFLIYVRDEDYYQLLPEELGGSKPGDKRVKVMAFPPLGIETLAPVVRQRGHYVDVRHLSPRDEKGGYCKCGKGRTTGCDCIVVSFHHHLYANQVMAACLKSAAPEIPIILGGVFASMNAEHILRDCPYADCIGVGEGEELLPDYLDHMDDPGSVIGLVWRDGNNIVSNPSRPIIRDLDQFAYPDRDSLPIDYIESLPLDVPAVLSLENSVRFRLHGAALTAAFFVIFLR